MPFQYKHVLLVGATSGIGAAMADKLVQEGAKVIAVGRRQDRLDGFVKRHGQEKASAERFDITDKAGLDAFVSKILTTYPDLDCVFLNSGVQRPHHLARPGELDLEAFHAEINTNFTSVVNMMMKFLPHLQAKTQPTGLIITGSGLGLIPAPSLPAYSASKAALNSFIDSARAQNEKAGTRTKIIEIWPPLVQTELHDYAGEEKGRAMGMPVDVFTEKAYALLAAGSTHVVVGSVGTASEDQFNELIEKKRLQFDGLSKLMLSQFQV